MSVERDIFRSGSTTYYWSSKLFPIGVRDDVFKLYSFVRVVDDFVDQIPSEIDRFQRMVKRWQEAKKDLASFRARDGSVDERVLQNIAYIVHRYDCDPEWVDSFLASMQMDVDQREYKTLNDTLEYIYGSAEVIGLFMAKILRLPEESHHSAMMQGRAMQFINFIRDIAEDNQLDRQYFPADDLKKHSLKNLTRDETFKKPEAYTAFMSEQLARYEEWQSEADKGMKYIPKRMRIALKTAIEAYNWTGEQVKKDPFVVYEKKVKPSKKHLFRSSIKNSIR